MKVLRIELRGNEKQAFSWLLKKGLGCFADGHPQEEGPEISDAGLGMIARIMAQLEEAPERKEI